MLKRNIVFLALCLSVLNPAWADPLQYDEESRKAAQDFVKQLGGALKAELEKGNAESAIGVCRDLAPKIANRVSLETGWKVTRVGTRVRNPMIGTPDAWEQATLAEFERRLKGGEKADGMEFSALVEEPSGKSYRYMKAIGTQKLCMACHGAPGTLSDGVKQALAKQYPHDQATGYQEGQLRGAISIKRPL